MEEDDISREELFDIFNFDVNEIKKITNNPANIEKILKIAEDAMRMINKTDNQIFDNIWSVKHLALPQTRELISHSNEPEQLRRDFFNQIGSDILFSLWLNLASSLVSARYLMTMQLMFGDEVSKGSESEWYEKTMEDYFQQVTRPNIDSMVSFLKSIEWNETDDEKNDSARDITHTGYTKELSHSLEYLMPEFKKVQEKIYKKLIGLYLESMVYGGDIEMDEM